MKKLSAILILIGLVSLLAGMYFALHENRILGGILGVIGIGLLSFARVLIVDQTIGTKIASMIKRVYKTIIGIITLRRIIITLIIIRVLRYLHFMYYEVSNWLYVVKNSIKISFGEPNVLFVILIDILILLILIFDTLTIAKLRSKNISFIRYGLFSCIGNFLIFIYLVCNRIMGLIRLMNYQGVGNMNIWRISHISFYDLMNLIVFLSALTQLIIVTKFKDKLITRTIGLAEPVLLDYEDNHSETIKNG